MYKIVPAHWSINQNDTHTDDDEDCTYALYYEGDDYIDLLGLFNNKENAVNCVKTRFK